MPKSVGRGTIPLSTKQYSNLTWASSGPVPPRECAMAQPPSRRDILTLGYVALLLGLAISALVLLGLTR